MSKSRIGSVDIAKGIAMICIFLGHIRIKAVNPFVYSFHIPLFLLVTGYFISTKSSVKEFSLKRLKNIMIPYAVTCAVIILLAGLLGLRGGTALADIKKWALASVYGSGTTYQEPFWMPMIGPLWYLPASCLAAILFRCTLNLPDKWRPFVVIALFVAGYVSSTHLFWFPMSVQAGFCCVLFLYVGWLFRQNQERIQSLRPEVKIASVLAGALIWVSFIRNFDGLYVVRNFYGKTVLNIFCSVCGCGVVVLASYFLDKKTKIISGLLRYIGRYSLLVMCVHSIEQNLIKWDQVFAPFFTLPEDTFKYCMIIFRPAVVLLVVWLLLKIPPVRKLFGYSRDNA